MSLLPHGNIAESGGLGHEYFCEPHVAYQSHGGIPGEKEHKVFEN
jgi:hypothetical protein